MTSKLDLSLDDIISSRPKFSGNNGRRRGPNSGRSDRRNGNGRANNSLPYSRPNGSPRSQGINEVGKILVSNLHYAVSEHDLKELFSQVGPVRSATLIFDSRGQSQGSGIVIFNRGPDAMRAVKQFNGVTLDNRAMRIAIPVTPDTKSNKPVSSRVGPSNNSGRDRNSRGNNSRNNGRNGGSRRPKSEPRPTKTVEDLDAELDAYLAVGS